MRILNRIILVLVFLLVGIFSVSFDWEGELDPNEFDKWKVISIQPTPQGLVWMFVKNPDQAAPVDIVAMAVDLDFTLFGYRYFKYGIPYSYVFDVEQGKYVQHRLTDEQRRSCMKCHRDKLIPQADI